ncbi:MAG TPA: hypothetical protein VJL59_13675 [Anaerolineales bacterium]|nr:hypothetical protein [Anaerolineales bacterium]
MKTIWDVWITKRFRWGALLIVGGVVGFLLIGFILRLPLIVTILLCLFFGVWGVAAAVLESIVKAVANSRAPFTFRQREPYEFVRHQFGHINLAMVLNDTIHNDHLVTIWLSDNSSVALSDKEAENYIAFMDEIATPLNAVALNDTDADVRFSVDEARINEIEMWRGRRPF